MKKGELPASDQLKSAIANKDLVQIHTILDRIIIGRLVPQAWDEVALAGEIRSLKGKLEGRKDSRSWKKRGKIDRHLVARECRAALEKMGKEVTEEMRTPTNNGRNSPFRRVNTGEFFVRIRNRNRR